METIWDWVTIFGFAGLVTLLLQRSSEDEPRDKLWQYAPPAIACAVANQVGNADYHLAAAAILIAAGVYVYYVLGVRANGN